MCSPCTRCVLPTRSCFSVKTSKFHILCNHGGQSPINMVKLGSLSQPLWVVSEYCAIDLEISASLGLHSKISYRARRPSVRYENSMMWSLLQYDSDVKPFISYEEKDVSILGKGQTMRRRPGQTTSISEPTRERDEWRGVSQEPPRHVTSIPRCLEKH